MDSGGGGGGGKDGNSSGGTVGNNNNDNLANTIAEKLMAANTIGERGNYGESNQITGPSAT